MKPVTNLEQVLENIDVLNRSVANNPELAGRLGEAHAYYAVGESHDGARFGFSKFIDYAGQTDRRYLGQYKEMDGRNTEFALKPWFEELRYGTSAYKVLLDQLGSWLSGFGKKPSEGGQQKLRLMVLKPEFREQVSTGAERKLLDLLIAVADMLPLDQRHQLRAVL